MLAQEAEKEKEKERMHNELQRETLLNVRAAVLILLCVLYS